MLKDDQQAGLARDRSGEAFHMDFVNETPFTPISNRVEPTAAMRVLLSLIKHIRIGSLTIVLADGQRFTGQGTQPGPNGEVWVYDQAFASRMLTGGRLGFTEAYMDGLCDSPDLTALLEVTAINQDHISKALTGRPFARLIARVWHGLRRNSRAGSRKNISYHYDLGNDFYRRWLDPSMTYSSAVFANESQNLEDAQRNKYRRIAEIAGLSPGDRVLEIGCGWGGFAEYAAREVGCHVTGVTVSQEQFQFAKTRLAEAGLSDRTEIRLEDYRDIRDGGFDRVVSIEMFEAVGETYWPTFFKTVHDVLRPGGTAGLQIITIADSLFADYRRSVDFIQRYIFPGGMLPSPTVFSVQA